MVVTKILWKLKGRPWVDRRKMEIRKIKIGKGEDKRWRGETRNLVTKDKNMYKTEKVEKRKN